MCPSRKLSAVRFQCAFECQSVFYRRNKEHCSSSKRSGKSFKSPWQSLRQASCI